VVWERRPVFKSQFTHAVPGPTPLRTPEKMVSCLRARKLQRASRGLAGDRGAKRSCDFSWSRMRTIKQSNLPHPKAPKRSPAHGDEERLDFPKRKSTTTQNELAALVRKKSWNRKKTPTFPPPKWRVSNPVRITRVNKAQMTSVSAAGCANGSGPPLRLKQPARRSGGDW